MEKIRFQKNSDEMMRVISEQKKSLYLKAYVGSVYKDGVWRKMPEGQDPLQWFLTTSRPGDQMLYAEQIKKNAAMILLGAVTVLVIAGFILFVILEIRLWLLEQTLKKQYEQADMD